MGFNFDPHRDKCPICQKKFHKSYLNQNFFNYFLECSSEKDHSLKILIKNLKISYFNYIMLLENKNKIKIKVLPDSLHNKTLVLSKEENILFKSTDLLFNNFDDLTKIKEKLELYLTYI